MRPPFSGFARRVLFGLGIRRGIARTLLSLLTLAPLACGSREDVVVGSKNFTESIVLGEIVAQQLEGAGLTVDRRFNLGGLISMLELIDD